MDTSNSDDTTYLSQVTIQADLQSVIDDVRNGGILVEDVWVSCYTQRTASVHGKAAVSLSNDSKRQIEMEGRDGVQARSLDGYLTEVTCPSLGIKSRVLRAPKHVYGEAKSQQIPKAIQSFDVAPDGERYATGFENGSISVLDARPSSPLAIKTGKPHVSGVTRLRFFPSNEVLLSCSMDMSVAVISALDPTNVPRRFKGHSRAVTDTAIIDQGKNVLSCGKDGTVRLWDVGAGKQIKLFGVESYSPALCMTLGIISSGPVLNNEGTTSTVLEGEHGTSDKITWCALQSGRFTGLDLRTKDTTYTSPTETSSGGPLQSICYDSQGQMLATGSASGIINIYDARMLSSESCSPLHKCTRNGASVEDLAFNRINQSGNISLDLLVATADGLPYRLRVQPELAVVEEYVGHDCDPVRAIVPAGAHIWTAGDDGLVRCY